MTSRIMGNFPTPDDMFTIYDQKMLFTIMFRKHVRVGDTESRRHFIDNSAWYNLGTTRHAYHTTYIHGDKRRLNIVRQSFIFLFPNLR